VHLDRRDRTVEGRGWVNVIEKNVLASISATPEVVHCARIFKAQLARHERVFLKMRAKVNAETK
jgi:hypothetical protein